MINKRDALFFPTAVFFCLLNALMLFTDGLQTLQRGIVSYIVLQMN